MVAALPPGDHTDPATPGLQLRVRAKRGDFSRTWLLRYRWRDEWVRIVIGHYKDRGGIFVRGSGLYDWKVMDDTTGHVQFTHDAKGVIGSYTRLLDAFGFWRFDLGSSAAEIRLGRQVVDWGESTFIPNGLNEVNHFDVTALQVPGAELKQALLPDEMAVFNLQLSKNLSTQLLYLFDWHEDIIEPDGAYFSTNDFAGPGGNKVFLGFGAISDQGVDFTSLGGTLIRDFQAVPRLPDQKPSQSGQFGVNFKLYLPNFSQGTQLGFYFLNYTSRLPVVSAQTGQEGPRIGAPVGASWCPARALRIGRPHRCCVQFVQARGCASADLCRHAVYAAL